jgi:hypothetical protein
MPDQFVARKDVVRVGGACGPPPPVVARKLALLPAATPRLMRASDNAYA